MELNRNRNEPFYRQVYADLKSQILSGKYKEGQLLPSERELGDIYGVNRITVRKALNILVEERLTEKKAGLGTQVIKRYSPAADVQTDVAPNILFFMCKSDNLKDRITEPFNVSLFYNVEKQCGLNGAHLTYKTAGANESLTAVCYGIRVSGIIFASIVDEKMLLEARRAGIPFVLLNNHIPGYTSVSSDNINGSYKVVSHMIQSGRKKIAFVSGSSGYVNADERYEGYRRALADNQISYDPDYDIKGDWSYESGKAAGEKLLSYENKAPTAIFAANDTMAFGVCAAIRNKNLSIPNDICVAGFDNIDQCSQVSPSLTTVSVNFRSMARAACQQLFSIIKSGSGSDMKLHIVVPADLIIRDSTI